MVSNVFLLAMVLLAISTMAVAQDWTMVNYDSPMSRHSPQTIISKENVNELQVKWILNTNFTLDNPPLIIGKTGYIQTNDVMQVIAFDLDTGLCKWKYSPNQPANASSGTISHGLAYDNGIIYAPTGPAATIVALNAENGSMIWESPVLMPSSAAYVVNAPPLIWKDYIIVGSALDDAPSFEFPAKGMVTAIDKNTGKLLWQINTTIGDWVEGNNASINGGAATWSGGSIDTEKGIVYLPCGNPAPDFDASSRPGKNLYANCVIAVNISDGKVLWATPFVASGTVLNVTIPDTHDWDTSWGTNLVIVDYGNGPLKVVIGHNRRGDIMSMDADTGELIWWRNIAVLHNESIPATSNGTSATWPGSGVGIEDYTAFDNNTVYAGVSNQGRIFYGGPGVAGHSLPDFESMPNGIGNGSIVALDLRTGNIKWEHKTDFPIWASPLVTNGVVFSGHVTAVGTPYKFDPESGDPVDTPLIPSGILIALDADTGKLLWQFNVGAPVGLGGPSIGNGLLIVPTGSGQTPNDGGYLVAFGLNNICECEYCLDQSLDLSTPEQTSTPEQNSTQEQKVDTCAGIRPTGTITVS
jgi:alcohol dehydrogenase (cytochrome c)